MRTWRGQQSHFLRRPHSSASGTSSASSLIQFFSIVLDLLHLSRIFVFDSVRIGMGEPHQHARIA
jgi:hypothetical protein